MSRAVEAPQGRRPPPTCARSASTRPPSAASAAAEIVRPRLTIRRGQTSDRPGPAFAQRLGLVARARPILEGRVPVAASRPAIRKPPWRGSAAASSSHRRRCRRRSGTCRRRLQHAGKAVEIHLADEAALPVFLLRPGIGIEQVDAERASGRQPVEQLASRRRHRRADMSAAAICAGDRHHLRHAVDEGLDADEAGLRTTAAPRATDVRRRRSRSPAGPFRPPHEKRLRRSAGAGVQGRCLSSGSSSITHRTLQRAQRLTASSPKNASVERLAPCLVMVAMAAQAARAP